MRELGDDIVLLAMKPNGKLDGGESLRFAVAGSELVRLAAARRVDIVDRRIKVLDARPTGDRLLDAALTDIRRSKRPPRPRDWVAKVRPGLVQRYLRQLAEEGVLRLDQRKTLGMFARTRWYVVDVARAQEARARLDAVAHSQGPVSSEQSALGGLVHAVKLDVQLYPGRSGRAARERLSLIARQDHAAKAVRGAVRAAQDSALQASVQASSDAAITAATQAATSAAVQAAVQASLSAAVDASVSAAAQAHHAAHHNAAIGGAIGTGAVAGAVDAGGGHHHH